MPNRIRRRLTGEGKGPWILVSAVVVALLVTPFAIAAGEGRPLLGGTRNPGTNESLELTRETEIIANTASYGTRQSNKSTNGGGAIYGCRSGEGGTPAGNRPCVRANNLANGRAFEFATGGGAEVGRIESTNAAAAPFSTNALGVAGGLNADRVDGRHADELIAEARSSVRFAVVGANGALNANRGVTSAARTDAGEYTVTFPDDVSACAYQVTPSTNTDAGPASVQAIDARSVRVVTRSAALPAPNTIADKPFHLTVTC